MELHPSPLTNTADRGGLAAAIARGELARLQWTRDGTLLSPEAFAARRGITPAELDQLEARGQLFSLAVGGARWYPAELLRMSAFDGAALCETLGELEPTEKLIFVMRVHGALGGSTAADAIAAGGIDRVLSLAAGWLAQCAR